MDTHPPPPSLRVFPLCTTHFSKTNDTHHYLSLKIHVLSTLFISPHLIKSSAMSLPLSPANEQKIQGAGLLQSVASHILLVATVNITKLMRTKEKLLRSFDFYRCLLIY